VTSDIFVTVIKYVTVEYFSNTFRATEWWRLDITLPLRALRVIWASCWRLQPLLPQLTSKYPSNSPPQVLKCRFHQCIYLSCYVILWVKKSKEHKFTGCSYLCFPMCRSVLGHFTTYSICFWSICRAEPLYNLLHGHFLLSVVLYCQSSRIYIYILGTADSNYPCRWPQFRCLSMVYSSEISLKSQLSCKILFA